MTDVNINLPDIQHTMEPAVRIPISQVGFRMLLQNLCSSHIMDHITKQLQKFLCQQV